MIGCFSLARETFDIKFAKKKLATTKRIIKKLNKNINFFDELITNDEIGKSALKHFENSKCTKFIVIQSTFTDAKFISSFVKKFKKPVLFISFKEKRSGGRLRLNSLCGVNLGLHALIKSKFYSNFIIFTNEERSFSNEILKFIKLALTDSCVVKVVLNIPCPLKGILIPIPVEGLKSLGDIIRAL